MCISDEVSVVLVRAIHLVFVGCIVVLVNPSVPLALIYSVLCAETSQIPYGYLC